MRPYPPLGTLYAANHLRQAGYSVAVFDAMLANEAREFESLLEVTKPRLVAFYEDQFNFLNKMCLSHVRNSIFEMTRYAKAQNTTVIAAGSDLTDEPQAYFEKGVDFIMNGEADNTLLEISDCIFQKRYMDISKIPGISFPLSHTSIVFPGQKIYPTATKNLSHSLPRKLEADLDVFPLPAWDLLDARRYRQAWKENHGFFSLNMVASRGCTFHCNWCAKPIWGQHYAVRSAASVAEEMALLKNLHNPDHIWFADDIFGLNPRWEWIFVN